jgi:altronate hydrolase
MKTKYLQINPADNVAVAIENLSAGENIVVNGIQVTLKEDIPVGHKFALNDLAEGENIIKYGYPIGHATTAKKQGEWMNETNIKTNLSKFRWIFLRKTLRSKAIAARVAK